MTQHTELIILGQGIAGMFAALICAEHGYHVKIIGMPAPAKGAMQLAENSFECVQALHSKTAQQTGKKILESGYRLHGIDILRLNDSAALTALQHPEGRYYAAVSKAQLIQRLKDQCSRQDNITFYEAFAQSGIVHYDRTHAQIVTTDNVLHQAEFVLGADGPKGLSRRLIHSSPPIVDYAAMRAEISSDMLPGFYADRQSRLLLGQKCHLVSYPFADAEKVNIVFCAEDQHLRAGWQDFYFSENPALHALKDERIDWHKTEIMAPFTSALWRYQRLTLIGDAAHMMPPHLAQGAGQSFEDIAILDEMLATYSLEKAFDQMALKRNKHAAFIASKAALTGKVMRLGGAGATMRNHILNIGGQDLLENWMGDVWSYPHKRPATSNLPS